jgi:hypothetical protein
MLAQRIDSQPRCGKVVKNRMTYDIDLSIVSLLEWEPGIHRLSVECLLQRRNSLGIRNDGSYGYHPFSQ